MLPELSIDSTNSGCSGGTHETLFSLCVHHASSSVPYHGLCSFHEQAARWHLIRTQKVNSNFYRRGNGYESCGLCFSTVRISPDLGQCSLLYVKHWLQLYTRSIFALRASLVRFISLTGFLFLFSEPKALYQRANFRAGQIMNHMLPSAWSVQKASLFHACRWKPAHQNSHGHTFDQFIRSTKQRSGGSLSSNKNPLRLQTLGPPLNLWWPRGKCSAKEPTVWHVCSFQCNSLHSEPKMRRSKHPKRCTILSCCEQLHCSIFPIGSFVLFLHYYLEIRFAFVLRSRLAHTQAALWSFSHKKQ